MDPWVEYVQYPEKVQDNSDNVGEMLYQLKAHSDGCRLKNLPDWVKSISLSYLYLTLHWVNILFVNLLNGFISTYALHSVEYVASASSVQLFIFHSYITYSYVQCTDVIQPASFHDAGTAVAVLLFQFNSDIIKP